jgi:hypothetical protein
MRALAAAVALAACTAPPPPPGSAGPAEAVQDLAAALQKGDAATAWSLLSARTQAQADQLAARARVAAGDAGPETGRAMLFASAIPLGPVEARVVSESADTAEVRTASADGGGGRHYHVVRESGRWRVDLDLSR